MKVFVTGGTGFVGQEVLKQLLAAGHEVRALVRAGSENKLPIQTVILGATQSGAPAAMAGLAIGLTLTAIHLVGIKVTGVSVNPARSIGPALFVGGQALADLWVFIVAPLAGGALAGLVHKAGFTRAD